MHKRFNRLLYTPLYPLYIPLLHPLTYPLTPSHTPLYPLYTPLLHTSRLSHGTLTRSPPTFPPLYILLLHPLTPPLTHPFTHTHPYPPPQAAAWNVSKIPSNFSFGEIEPDWTRMGPFVEKGGDPPPGCLFVCTPFLAWLFE